MSVINGNQGNLYVQAESSLGGSGTGTIYRLPVVGFEEGPSFTARETRIGFIRQAVSQSIGGQWHGGRIELEAASTHALRLLVRTLFARHSFQVVTATEHGFGFPNVGDVNLQSVKLFAHYDGGPFLQFDGVILQSFRLTVRSKEIARVSMQWLGQAVTEAGSDPGLTTTQELPAVSASDSGLIQIDDVTHDQVIEATVEFRNNASAGAFNDSGAPSKWTRGPFDITGSIVEYFDKTKNLPQLVRSLTEAKVSISAVSQSSSDEYLKAQLPRVVFESGSPSPVDSQDVAATVGFRAMENSVLGSDRNELLFSIL
jgi:hypothetical protein